MIKFNNKKINTYNFHGINEKINLLFYIIYHIKYVNININQRSYTCVLDI